jgi:AraC-like DNA-binding protein
MLLVALTCLRARAFDADVAAAALTGDVHDALSIGLTRLDRMDESEVQRRAVLGQLIGQLLLSSGREEQAEEHFRKQLRVYDGMSRRHVRWLSSLDRGHMFLHLNRCGLAAECFNVVADDEEAPQALRVEALAALAQAIHGLGEHGRATRTLAHALHLSSNDPCGARQLLEAIQLDVQVTSHVRQCLEAGSAQLGPAPAASTLRAMAKAMASLPIVARRLTFLASLVEPGLGTPGAAMPLFDTLRWWRERRLARAEEMGRIEASLALVEVGDAHTAGELLGGLAFDETRLQHHRHAIEIGFILSRMHALQGRYMDALRCLRQHSSQSLTRLRAELQRVPYSRFLAQQQRADQTDADQLRLPLRYRQAYQFILEHLHEKTLSTRRIAAHIDVSERALQMAFRSHLGLTPAELVLRLRMAGIRTELQRVPGRESVLAVAHRWGLNSRSALTQNYRQRFGESPTATSGSLDVTRALPGMPSLAMNSA